MLRTLLLLSVVTLISGCASPAPAGPTLAPAASPSVPAVATPLPRPDIVRIEMYEWSINVDPPELPAGRYRVEVVNYGERLHSVSVVGPGVDLESRRLRAGGVQEIEIEIGAGEYTLWCPIGDHRDYGMVTYLTVPALASAEQG